MPCSREPASQFQTASLHFAAAGSVQNPAGPLTAGLDRLDKMTPAFLIFLVGLLYVVIFWSLSLLRRERLSNQFAYEGLSLTGITYAAVYWGGMAVHPIYFLVLLYFVTMRVRLLVELGNMLSKWGRHQQALAVYRLGLRLFPDRSSRLIALINMGAAYLVQGKPERTIEVLENAKAQVLRQLGPKQAAGCCYNLGMAYRRTGRHADALRQFCEVSDIYPVSIYAKLAEKARNSTLEETGMMVLVPKEEDEPDRF
jgi:tetratricopeptide (TPR) repeat protein